MGRLAGQMVGHVFWISGLLAATVALQPAIDIGSRLELFVDHHLIESMDGARLELHLPRDEGEVFRFDKPWEGPFCGYATVIAHDGEFLLFYRGLPRAGVDGTNAETTCVARSSDGREWVRPSVGLHEVGGSRDNNVILADVAPVTHNFSPFVDTRPGVPADERFKGLGGSEHSGLVAWASPDGVHWQRMQDEPVLTDGMFDSQNVAFWSGIEECYVSYFRTWTGGGYSGYRTVSRATSPDFIVWSETEPMTFGDTPLEHLYTNQTHPYFRAPHIYVAIAARFMPGRQVVSPEDARELGVSPRYFADCSDAVLMTSRGGTVYDRTFMEGFIRPGIGLQNWVSRANYPALNVVQTGDAEMSIFVNHDYAQPTAHLRRFSLRLDGFASVRGPRAGGEMITRMMRFSGSRLSINFATSAAGQVRVELQDAQGAAIPGFAIDDCQPQIGNEIERVVRWQGGTDVSFLTGKDVRIRFELIDADLFALQFVP